MRKFRNAAKNGIKLSRYDKCYVAAWFLTTILDNESAMVIELTDRGVRSHIFIPQRSTRISKIYLSLVSAVKSLYTSNTSNPRVFRLGMASITHEMRDSRSYQASRTLVRIPRHSGQEKERERERERERGKGGKYMEHREMWFHDEILMFSAAFISEPPLAFSRHSQFPAQHSCGRNNARACRRKEELFRTSHDLSTNQVPNQAAFMAGIPFSPAVSSKARLSLSFIRDCK